MRSPQTSSWPHGERIPATWRRSRTAKGVSNHVNECERHENDRKTESYIKNIIYTYIHIYVRLSLKLLFAPLQVLLKNDELLRKKLLLALWEGPYFARAVANIIGMDPGPLPEIPSLPKEEEKKKEESSESSSSSRARSSSS